MLNLAFRKLLKACVVVVHDIAPISRSIDAKVAAKRVRYRALAKLIELEMRLTGVGINNTK